MKRLAKKESEKSSARFKVGAVIYKGRKVLSKACNNTKKTCPHFGSGSYKFLHSEGQAIKKAVRRGINLEGSSIYVYRKGGMLAKPCPDCAAMIEKYGITKVFYTGG